MAQNLLKYQAVSCPKNLQEIAISADTEYRVFWIPDKKIPFKWRVQSAAKSSLKSSFVLYVHYTNRRS